MKLGYIRYIVYVYINTVHYINKKNDVSGRKHYSIFEHNTSYVYLKTEQLWHYVCMHNEIRNVFLVVYI